MSDAQPLPQHLLESFVSEQGAAERMIPAVGELYRKHGIIVTVFGRKLMNESTVAILKAHRLARFVVNDTVTVQDSSQVLSAVQRVLPGSCRIDIGKLAHTARQRDILEHSEALDAYLRGVLKTVPPAASVLEEPQDIVLYGFGRIGRILARLLIERTTSSNPMRLRAIVVRGGRDGDLEKRASLLRRDSVHGSFNGSINVDVDQSAIIANGNFIKVIYADKPEDIDYTHYGIDKALIVDNTGVFKDEVAPKPHRQLSQGRATWAQRALEHGSDVHGCRQGGGQGLARARRQTHR